MVEKKKRMKNLMSKENEALSKNWSNEKFLRMFKCWPANWMERNHKVIEKFERERSNHE